MWNSTSISNIWIAKLLKSCLLMWNICTQGMCKHSTSIGNFLKSYQLMWNAHLNFSLFGKIWKVTNWYGMLAQPLCASIPHRLVTFRRIETIFNIFPHQLVSFQKVTNRCGMLAHTNYLVEPSFWIRISVILNSCNSCTFLWKNSYKWWYK